MTIQGARIHRTTMFKVPDQENQRKLLQAYNELSRTNEKVRSHCVHRFVPSRPVPVHYTQGGYTPLIWRHLAALLPPLNALDT